MKITELDIREAKLPNEEKKLKAELRKLGLSTFQIAKGKIVSHNGNVSVKYRPEMANDENYVKDGKLVHQFESVSGDFICRDLGLKTLEGCPNVVVGNFDCSVNNLTTLNNGPTCVLGDYICTQNQITSFENVQDSISQIDSGLYFSEKKIKKGIIHLTQIKGLKRISNHLPQFKIVEHYLNEPNKIFDCQQELIEAGFEEFAE